MSTYSSYEEITPGEAGPGAAAARGFVCDENKCSVKINLS